MEVDVITKQDLARLTIFKSTDRQTNGHDRIYLAFIGEFVA